MPDRVLHWLLLDAAWKDRLLPPFDVVTFYREHLGVEWNYDLPQHVHPVPEVAAALHATPLPPEVLARIATLDYDATNEICSAIWPKWDGEDDTFDIRDLSGIEACTGLREIQLVSAALTSIAPLRGLMRLESFVVEANTTPIADLSPLLDLPALETLSVDYQDIPANRKVLATLRARGVRDGGVVSGTTQTLRNDTRASDPGGLTLSHAKLQQLQPELLSAWRWVLADKRKIRYRDEGREWLLAHVEEHLKHGDSRAAIVVAVDPLCIAAYSDELDAVALLGFDRSFARQQTLTAGQRLLGVNTYLSRDAGVARDLVEGRRARGTWGNFVPYVADFLSDDTARIEARKAAISEAEWQRTARLADERIKRYGLVARDGRPLMCASPAAVAPPAK